MRPHVDEMLKHGARLVVIGNGWPAMAKAFAAHAGLPESVTLLTDPTRQSYLAAGLKRGVLMTLGPRGWLAFARTWKKGFRQGRTAGDPWQQGGALVVAKGGEVLYRHLSTGPSDQADPRTLVSSLPQAA